MTVDRLLINANVYTLADEPKRASVIVIHEGRIAAVGDKSLRSQVAPGTPIDDLGGAMLLPELVDAHIHWQWTAESLAEISLFDVPSKAEAVRRVAEAASKTPPNDWLKGWGWAQASWENGGAFPTAADLDAVSPNNPVYLKARSGHAGWANTLALQAAGITGETSDPVGGVIQHDSTGRPTGILFESAMGLVSAAIPPTTTEKLADLMAQLQERAWQSGLTGIHDFDDPTAFAAMQVLYERGDLGLRVVKNINRGYIDSAIRLGLRWGFGNDWLRLGGLKLFADGALGPRTAFMIAPYEGEPENCGVIVTPKQEMYKLVSAASRAGFPSTIHAIGDQAVRDVLDVYEVVRREEAERGILPSVLRHRIEHVQIIHPSDVKRLAELQIIASMQPIHATSDYQMADRYWGARSQWSYNARLQIDSGARVAFGSDSPVEPFDPLKGIHAAVTRRRADGSPGLEGWYPAARLTIDEAIRGYTQGPAYAGGMEARLGKIVPGYLADLTVLDRDLYKISPDDLLNVQVVGTMVGGEWRHRTF